MTELINSNRVSLAVVAYKEININVVIVYSWYNYYYVILMQLHFSWAM